MALPKAVQRLADEADQIVDTLTAKPGQQPETGQEPINNDPPQDPPQDPPAQGNDTSTVTTQTPSPVPDETWQQKYHILQGKYDAEVPRLHSQLRELNTQVQSLIEAKAVAEAKAAKAPEPVKSLVTEQDKEAFGSDLIDLIDRATESKVSVLRDRETTLLDEIEKLKGQLGSVSERQVVSHKDSFLMGLSQKVPDWEALNTDQGFLAWLSEVDPVYGLPRQAALTTAYEALDVNRVAAIFSKYKEVTAPKQPDQPKAKPSDQLQRQVAPTRTRTTNAPQASDAHAKIWTEGEISGFYDEWRRGFIDNEEAARIEKEITTAITEGRVR